MAGALTAALSAPLHRLLALVGPGHITQPGAALAGLQQHLDATAHATARTRDQLLGSWAGSGATSAADRLDSAVVFAHQLGARVGMFGDDVDAAAAAVTRVRAALERLIADFEAQAAALEAQLDSPGASDELVDEARRALAAATQMIDDLRAELSAGAPGVTAETPAATRPAGLPSTAPTTAFGAGPGSGMGSGAGSAMGSGLTSGMGSGVTSALGSGLGPALTEASLAAHHGRDLPDAAQFGAGEAVTLPDGSTVLAPNAVAAGAVRHALTQLGVPYQWGGTTAGVGLDCSGLTQWAYHEAGLNIPRLAQEQDIGTAVDAGALRPGDLAVWDGHVAMVVGDGTMIEAGDPVKLSAIRTTNAGQGFQGFWRPTA
jgi:peptidoglycan DL-endopeptidase CwlO